MCTRLNDTRSAYQDAEVFEKQESLFEAFPTDDSSFVTAYVNPRHRGQEVRSENADATLRPGLSNRGFLCLGIACSALLFRHLPLTMGHFMLACAPFCTSYLYCVTRYNTARALFSR